MKLKRLLLLTAFVTAFGALQAQDIHFSLFNMSPLSLNPALTGAYPGTARIGGIYRDQWASFLPNQFTTPSFFIDAPIIRGFRKNDWVGVGMLTINDQAGTSRMRTSVNMFSASYHLALDKDAKTVITLGLQGGSVQRSFSFDDLIFADESELTGGMPGSSQDRNINTNTSYLDFGTGLMLRTQLSNQSNIEAGLAFGHITRPKGAAFQVTDDDDARRPMRIAAHATYNTKLTDQWSLSPTAFYQTTGGATELAIQGWTGYQLKPEIKLNFGLGYRVADAGQVLLGLDYEDLRVALSYDVNVSSLTEVSRYQGGFEIAAWYILKIFKQPDTRPSIICPQF